MIRHIAGFILRMAGWNIYNHCPPGLKKAVVVIAPHTSNLDFIIGWLAFKVLDVKSRFLIKKEFFFFPAGCILRWLGGVPVDRGAGKETFGFAKDLFDRYDSIFLTITPEGTRKYNPRWKKGFYVIAMRAKVPIVLGVLDYKHKRGGMEKTFDASGDYAADLKKIEAFYTGSHARHPEAFNLTLKSDV
jgi:1-acyl-sn-glycerol-3-phosphate acyltransferase